MRSKFLSPLPANSLDIFLTAVISALIPVHTNEGNSFDSLSESMIGGLVRG